jgi:hypothetical protein
MPEKTDIKIIEKVILIRKNNPCLYLYNIGDIVGLSGEAVRQILKSHGLPTRHRIKHLICNNCGKELNGTNKFFCSRKCQSEFNTVSLSCSYCGTIINRKIYNVRKVIMRRDPKLFFCNKYCQGKYIGNKHGFGKPRLQSCIEV